ncbi:uncharacterized protein HKW66_Vig0127810 [Vigna angularis]|uniref:Uncharacterized protein n=1 Tax=Phaseolus angularis TaxID=3914 RepID=A0A8T0K3A6_PHAAN|nr:uncharacterized protein HKW66_Vig0127810 [Vigna angularis]
MHAPPCTLKLDLHIFHVAIYPNEHMRYYDIKPDASFYLVLIKSAGKASALLHAHLLKLGHRYAHSGAAQETIRLLNDMLSSGNEPDEIVRSVQFKFCHQFVSIKGKSKVIELKMRDGKAFQLY